MTMPGMTGAELAKAMKKERDDLPIILCTGYNEQVCEKNAESLGIRELIMKPVGMQQLAEAIRNALTQLSMERRKHPRFSASKGSFVISRTNPYERCSLVDIGMSGLAFSHEMHSVPVDPSDQLAIMTPDGEILINGLRCRTVSDIPAGSGISLPEANHARRGVCFEALTLLQSELINQFIHSHTTALMH